MAQNHPEKKIAVMGYLCLDLFPDLSANTDWELIPGMLREIGSCNAFPGGVVGNTAIALHRLGVPVKLAGRVGDDIFGRILRDYFSEISSDYSEYLRFDREGHTGYCIVLSPLGQDRIFLAHRGSNDDLNAKDATDEFLAGTSLLHFGYPPLCRNFTINQGEELQNLFRQAHKHGLITSLDMSLPAPGSFSYSIDWREFLRRTMPDTDLFMPSIDELKFMLQPAEGDMATMLRHMAEKLINDGAGVVGIKLGSDGLYIRTSADARRFDFLNGITKCGIESWRKREFIVPCRQVHVVGTTGSGDATIAGFLAGVISGASPEISALLAVGTGACSVTAHDSVSGIRSLTEVRRLLAEPWPGLPLSFSTGTIPVLS